MAYKLLIQNMEKYIKIEALGEQTFESNVELAESCMDACKKYNVKRAFVDITGLSGQPGAMADYELAKLLDAWKSGDIVERAALVENEADIPSGKFFETAARNRMLNVKVFSSKEEAEKWLKED